MKTLICLIILALFSAVPFKAMSQSPAYHSDTIYYYLDTAATPKNDRIVTLNSEPEYFAYKNKVDTIKYLTIECACLPFGNRPTFHAHQGHNLKKLRAETLNVSASLL